MRKRKQNRFFLFALADQPFSLLSQINLLLCSRRSVFASSRRDDVKNFLSQKVNSSLEVRQRLWSSSSSCKKPPTKARQWFLYDQPKTCLVRLGRMFKTAIAHLPPSLLETRQSGSNWLSLCRSVCPFYDLCPLITPKTHISSITSDKVPHFN